jgi:DNA-binding transcriptional regulator LsrR (DeoR family)
LTPEKVLFVAKLWSETPWTEEHIADLMGISKKQVSNAIHRAREIFRVRVEAPEELDLVVSLEKDLLAKFERKGLRYVKAIPIAPGHNRISEPLGREAARFLREELFHPRWKIGLGGGVTMYYVARNLAWIEDIPQAEFYPIASVNRFAVEEEVKRLRKDGRKIKDTDEILDAFPSYFHANEICSMSAINMTRSSNVPDNIPFKAHTFVQEKTPEAARRGRNTWLDQTLNGLNALVYSVASIEDGFAVTALRDSLRELTQYWTAEENNTEGGAVVVFHRIFDARGEILQCRYNSLFTGPEIHDVADFVSRGGTSIAIAGSAPRAEAVRILLEHRAVTHLILDHTCAKALLGRLRGE